MANTYVAPDFDLDTSTNVAGLTALKGGAPAGTDLIYNYNGATLTIEQNVAFLIAYMGQTKSGAAGVGQRYGLITCTTAGVAVTFAGHANQTSSGIVMRPTSADASSKGCSCVFTGTSGSKIAFNNSVAALNSNNKYIIWGYYGHIALTYCTVANSYTSSVYVCPSTIYSNSAKLICNYVDFTGINTGGACLENAIDNLTADIPCDFRFNTLYIQTGAVISMCGDRRINPTTLFQTGSWAITYQTGNSGTTYLYMGRVSAGGGTVYQSDWNYSNSDIRSSAPTISGTFTATLHASQNKVTLDLTGLKQTGGIYWVICVRQGSTPVGSEDAYKLYYIPIATTSFDIMQNYDGAQASHASLLYITVQIENASGVRTALGTAVSVTPHGYLEVND